MSYDFLVSVSMHGQRRLGVDVDWGDGKTNQTGLKSSVINEISSAPTSNFVICND